MLFYKSKPGIPCFLRDVLKNMSLIAPSTNVLDFGKQGDCLCSSFSSSMKTFLATVDKHQGIFFMFVILN